MGYSILQKIVEKKRKLMMLTRSAEDAWIMEEKKIIEKRLKWFEENKHKLKFLKGTDVEKAYRLFYLNYLKIKEEEIKIVEKSARKIVIRCYNFCPVLEACKELGLDTRVVCKKLYERPTQIFVKQINPKLKFKRNYDKIRPYTPFCEECIELAD
ncbi:MAG: hypothetical protein ACTSYM_03680 [Candidatus Baldrarchaeia archaeon]